MVRISISKILALGIAVATVFLLSSLLLLRDHDRQLSKRFLNPFKHQNMSVFPDGNRSNIMVTGGAGFLGSHLVDHLMQTGHQVIVVDSLVSGRRQNLAKWLHHPRFSLIELDINHPLEFRTMDSEEDEAKGSGGKNKEGGGGGVVTIRKPFCTHKRCKHRRPYHPRFSLTDRSDGRSLTMRLDEIYHLACPASVKEYTAHPVFTITTNTLGTLNILKLAKKAGAKVLLASTSEIYGDPTVVPQPEQYWGNVNPVGKRSSYSEGKRAAEAMFTAYNTEHGVDTRIARISNTYGPRLPSDGGGVVGSFIKQALSNSPIQIYGPGNQTRCLQYVTDAVKGMVKLMHSRATKPVNIAGTECFKVKELARLVISSTGSRSKIVNSPARQDDPKLRTPDVTLANQVLHWRPKVTLKEGLKSTIEYFKRHPKKSPKTDNALLFGA